MTVFDTTCADCDGSGTDTSDVCGTCNGTGTKPMTRRNVKALYIS